MICECEVCETQLAMARLKKENEKLRALNEKLSGLAYTDSLTGLWTRRQLELDLSYIIDNGCQDFTSAIFYLDINKFKPINDDYGHHVGDEALRFLAGILKSICRASEDRVYRLGGDEFVIFMSIATRDNILLIIESIKERLSKEIFRHGNYEGFLSVSIGSSIINNCSSVNKVIAEADSEMYKDKRKCA
ncbi:MAG: GGDEF domain-containing protein [Proteobacteria bacterium]|nr:GGDEF domain-containing protein [Pseudomonadota bacterium]